MQASDCSYASLRRGVDSKMKDLTVKTPWPNIKEPKPDNERCYSALPDQEATHQSRRRLTEADHKPSPPSYGPGRLLLKQWFHPREEFLRHCADLPSQSFDLLAGH